MGNNIYLIPYADSSYHACVASTPPSPEAIFLVKEGAYPVELYYNRYGIMGERITGRDICNFRDELIASLGWHGLCRHEIISLWDLEKNTRSDKLNALFASAYERHREMAPPPEDFN